ncbi:MAG: hypothetical protein JWM98_2749, partial [Thermoleophilia bacterium]|nr:hypothetical protein [Thermoleophilia bacterium]
VEYELARIALPVLLTAISFVGAYALPTGTGLAQWGVRLGLALAWPLVLVALGFVTPAERLRIRRRVSREGAR